MIRVNFDNFSGNGEYTFAELGGLWSFTVVAPTRDAAGKLARSAYAREKDTRFGMLQVTKGPIFKPTSNPQEMDSA